MKNLTSQEASKFLGKEVKVIDGNLVYENGKEIYQIITETYYEELGFDDSNDKTYITEEGENLIFVKQ